jgi:hypothetical protein
MKKSTSRSTAIDTSISFRSTVSNLDKLLSRLDQVKRIGNDRYTAICPAHDDRSPSLAIKDDGGRLLLHCFGGCDTSDVLGAVGFDFSDIMPDKCAGNFKKSKKPFYAMDILGIIKLEATLTYIYATDMAKGLMLTNEDKERLLLASSRINHAYEVVKNGL